MIRVENTVRRVLIALSRLTFSRVAMFPSLSFSKDSWAWEGLNKIAESFSASAWTVVLPSSGKRDSALRKLRAGAFLWFALNSMVTLRRVRNVVGQVEVRAVRVGGSTYFLSPLAIVLLRKVPNVRHHSLFHAPAKHAATHEEVVKDKGLT